MILKDSGMKRIGWTDKIKKREESAAIRQSRRLQGDGDFDMENKRYKTLSRT